MDRNVRNSVVGLRILSTCCILVACSQVPAARDPITPASSDGSLSEAAAIVIAREAFTHNEERSTLTCWGQPYFVASKDAGGWMVRVSRENPGPGEFRVIIIDENGSVVRYVRGL